MEGGGGGGVMEAEREEEGGVQALIMAKQLHVFLQPPSGLQNGTGAS